MVVVGAQRLQRVMRIQHAAAAGTKHVPGEIEQAKSRGVQETGNHPLFVKTGALRKLQQIDAVELVVLALIDQPHDGIGHHGIGGLLQYGNLGLDVAHAERLQHGPESRFSEKIMPRLDGIGCASLQCHQRDVTANIGEWSGWVVTTPTGTTGSLSSSSMRNAPTSLASARVASTSAKCAPMQIRGPTPNGR